MRWPRRDSMVSEVRRRLRGRLEPGERLLGWDRLAEGGFAAATNRGLFLPGDNEGYDEGRHRGPGTDNGPGTDDGPGTGTDNGPGDELVRLRWEQIDRVVWQRPELTVTEAAAVADEGAAHRVRLGDGARRLPELVRTRVEASIAWSGHHRLPGSRLGVRIVARRHGGQDGLVWGVVYDAGLDPAEPRVAAEVSRLLTAAQAATG